MPGPVGPAHLPRASARVWPSGWICLLPHQRPWQVEENSFPADQQAGLQRRRQGAPPGLAVPGLGTPCRAATRVERELCDHLDRGCLVGSRQNHRRGGITRQGDAALGRGLIASSPNVVPRFVLVQIDFGPDIPQGLQGFAPSGFSSSGEFSSQERFAEPAVSPSATAFPRVAAASLRAPLRLPEPQLGQGLGWGRGQASSQQLAELPGSCYGAKPASHLGSHRKKKHHPARAVSAIPVFPLTTLIYCAIYLPCELKFYFTDYVCVLNHIKYLHPA